MEKIEYEGIVWAIDHKYPEALVAHSIKRLQDYGIKKEDIVITDAPENVKVEAIVLRFGHTILMLKELEKLEMNLLSVEKLQR